MKPLLQSAISEEAFAECWEEETPPYPEFLEAAAQRLSRAVLGEVTELSATVKSWGTNRVRIDGTLIEVGAAKTYYVEIVWLPSSCSFRGDASAWNTPAAPKPKSMEEFIVALDGIQDEKELTLEGQIFAAMEGVDEVSEKLRQSCPAILRLFERFPDEESSQHNLLIELLERGGQHEELLQASLRRMPSVSAVIAAFNLAWSATTEEKRSKWVHEMQHVADSSDVSQLVSGCAKELLDQCAKQNDAD